MTVAALSRDLIVLEDGVWIGARALVCPGSMLARLSVVGAGVGWRGASAPAGVYPGAAQPDTPARRSA